MAASSHRLLRVNVMTVAAEMGACFAECARPRAQQRGERSQPSNLLPPWTGANGLWPGTATLRETDPELRMVESLPPEVILPASQTRVGRPAWQARCLPH